jgi:hypothetical protein
MNLASSRLQSIYVDSARNPIVGCNLSMLTVRAIRYMSPEKFNTLIETKPEHIKALVGCVDKYLHDAGQSVGEVLGDPGCPLRDAYDAVKIGRGTEAIGKELASYLDSVAYDSGQSYEECYSRAVIRALAAFGYKDDQDDQD